VNLQNDLPSWERVGDVAWAQRAKDRSVKFVVKMPNRMLSVSYFGQKMCLNLFQQLGESLYEGLEHQ
jgi:hypothetical protein